MKNIVVIEGPSGAGKDTLIRELVNKYPHLYIKMPSITSRAMREGESQGSPYFFVTREQFKQKIDSNEVFEFTVMNRDSEYRGMSKAIIDDLLKTDKVQLKDCDWVGIEALRREYPNRVLAIHINVPKEEVAKRIAERGGDVEDMAKRLADYDEYNTKIKKYCDITVNNTSMDECVIKLHEIISGSN